MSAGTMQVLSHSRQRYRFVAKEIAVFFGSVLLLTFSALIRVPLYIPVTLQTFAVMVLAVLLGPWRSASAVCAYTALGCCGAPVFAGFMGGPMHLLGPSGGYIIGFLFTAFVVGTISCRFGKTIPKLAFAMILGLIICYAFGTAWFACAYCGAFSVSSIGTALSICVVPFIIPDAIKIALAISVIKVLRR